ncbi:OPT oligopeptide transporter protein-domain-containing protein [Suillus cothurnatus]|nr:OPT oligopeptide transporter protein-domain-containing protein [Suillus cothurnatus]
MSLNAAGAISEHTVPSEKASSVTRDESINREGGVVETATVDADNEQGVLSDERDIATHVISVDDNAFLNPWTLRAFFIGLGLSTFGGQTVSMSLMFLAVVSYILGFFMETFIPRRGLLRYLNPGPFNKKENAFVMIMASASANTALGVDVLAVQRLYYNITPNPGTSVFLIFSSQLLGYGIGGMMRSILLYPSKMLYPGVLPLLSMFDALYEGGMAARKKLRIFYMVFAVMDISASDRQLLTIPPSREWLLSISFDWQYISGVVNPMVIPLKAQVLNLLGYILCMVVFVAVYYNNIWKAQNFPFLSQLLFHENGSLYDQTLILNSNYEVDPTLLAEQGVPYYSSTWGLGATFTHLLLWDRGDICSAWTWMSPSGIKNIWANFDWKFWQADGMRKQDVDDDDIDPHYKQMLKYPDAPNSWCFVVFLLSFVIALVVLYKTDSTLPWWGFLVSLLLATFLILFLGALGAITGLAIATQTFGQMIGGYMLKGLPVANMYFILYGDIMMNSIVDNQREILLSVQGTNIWSGQRPQMYNSQAIAWGGLSQELFSTGQRYQWVPWAYVIGLFVPVPFWVIHRYWPKLRADYLYTPIIAYVIGYLCNGITSSYLSYFAVAFFSQWWLRTRRPRWFAKYNYIVGAALDGGTQVMVFILSFAVQGAGGTSHPFPTWWGAEKGGNHDHCLMLN